jgi:hypothetical protein
VQTLSALRLTAALNAFAGDGGPGDDALVPWVVGPDVAHHVIDPDGLLGPDTTHAVPLADAVARLFAREPELWVLTLPVPGALGGLRGPKELNLAGLERGGAVVAATAGLALVPYRVGPAVQWRVFTAERPLLPTGPYDAERELGEAVVRAAATLQRLDVAAGTRPAEICLQLPAAYPNRQRLAADRAARLLLACDTALASDGNSVSSYESDLRSRELRAVRDAARNALCAAVTWCKIPGGPPDADQEQRRTGAIAGRRQPPDVSH